MTSASKFIPLWNRQSEWQRRLSMIAAAQSFLYVTTFYLEHDEYGIGMLKALQAAQKRGVAVTLLIDSFGQRLGGVLMSDEHRIALEREFNALRAAGGVVQFYQPPRFTQRLLGGGHHIKIQVSDTGEAIYGSSNITKSSFEGWNEYAVALRGQVVSVLLESVEALGVYVKPGHQAQLQKLAATEKADMELDYWFFNPNRQQGFLGPLWWHGQNTVTQAVIAMLDAAQHSVAITSFYFKPTRALMKAVLRAAHRGVAIEVFHSHRNALQSTDLAWIASAAGFGKLLRAGVTIYENLHGEHSKIVLVDTHQVAFGSYNFEDAAHDRLVEAMLVSRDVRAVQPAIEIFAELRSHKDNVRVPRHWFRELPLSVQTRILRYARFKWWM